MDITLAAETLYSAWCHHRAGKAQDGSPMPCWEAMPREEQAIWAKLADAAHWHARRRLDEAAALSKPVSGAAMADAASTPGYRAPELREQAAQSAPLRAALHAAVAHKDIYAEGMLGEVVDLLAADLQRLLGESLAGLLAAARSLEATRIDWDRRNIPADLGAWWAGKVRAKVAAPADKPAPQAAQAAPRPARPSPRTARCIGCRGTRQGVTAPQSHARVCPDYTQEDEAWCLAWWQTGKSRCFDSFDEALKEAREEVRRDRKYARYAPPRAEGVGAVEVRVGEPAKHVLISTEADPVVLGALALIDSTGCKIEVCGSEIVVRGRPVASCADPKAAVCKLVTASNLAAPLDLWPAIKAGRCVRLHPNGKPGVITKVHCAEVPGGDGKATLTVDFGHADKVPQ